MPQILVKMSESDDKYFPVIAEKIILPKGEEIGWNTVIRFDDGIQGFITIDRKFMKLTPGRTVEESYKIVRDKKIDWMDKLRKTEFNIYAYSQIIAGCSVGGRFPFKDIETGESAELSTYWNYSLRVYKDEQLVKEAANAESGKITTEYCSKALRERGNLHGILEQTIVSMLKEIPFSEIRSRNVDISNQVIKTFRDNNGPEITGFDIESFTLGDIKIADNY
jgi:hypothetical protein